MMLRASTSASIWRSAATAKSVIQPRMQLRAMSSALLGSSTSHPRPTFERSARPTTASRRTFWWSSSSTAAPTSPFAGSGQASYETFDFLPYIFPDLLPFFFALLLASRENDDDTQIAAQSQAAARQPPPYTVKSVPNKGFGAFATRDISRGEIILSERPLIVWPSKLAAEQANASLDSLTPSARRLYFSLADASDPNAKMDKALAIRATNGFNVELPSLPANLTPATLLQHPEMKPTSASFIFPKIARINHSCAANCDHAMDWGAGTLKMTVYATTDIREGEEINIEYTSALVQRTRAERGEILKRDFGFECRCRMCSLAEDEGLRSDARRREVDAIVGALARGGMERPAMWAALERVETLLDQEGYRAMPEFTEQRVSDTYVRFRTMRQQQRAAADSSA